jgi:hypothetical protein
MKNLRISIPVFIAFLAAAVIVRFWVTPQVTRLPADYSSETQCLVEDHFRETESNDWVITSLTNHRVDHTLSVTGSMLIIQGNLNVYSVAGDPIFESNGLYGVDRFTRMNVRGFGDADRSGQFLFPTQIKPVTYNFWDPLFIGSRTAVYDHSEKLNNMLVYVFNFSGTGMDETVGYSYMADVPEHFQAFTDGKGTLWIEPVSGVVVNYTELGESYFVNPKTGERGAVFHTWSGEYPEVTKAAQMALAKSSRMRILFFYNLLPAALALSGCIWLGMSLFQRRKQA